MDKILKEKFDEFINFFIEIDKYITNNYFKQQKILMENKRSDDIFHDFSML
jgi:hypothetical protein